MGTSKTIKIDKYDRNEWVVSIDGQDVGTLVRQRPERWSGVHGYVNDNSKPWMYSFVPDHKGNGTTEWDGDRAKHADAVRALKAHLAA